MIHDQGILFMPRYPESVLVTCLYSFFFARKTPKISLDFWQHGKVGLACRIGEAPFWAGIGWHCTLPSLGLCLQLWHLPGRQGSSKISWKSRKIGGFSSRGFGLSGWPATSRGAGLYDLKPRVYHKYIVIIVFTIAINRHPSPLPSTSTSPLR